jgi:Fur family ferric uptake transcriptional regulator
VDWLLFLAPSAAAGFEVDEAEIIFWGRCPDCIGKKEEIA